MVHFNLELIWLSRASPHVDLVFVHGYGGNPETTWHDESTGKIWIKDEEFITHIKRPIRIFSFSYNGDVEANLSSSSPAFHASDLLCCLEQALERSAGRPLIFIAHGFGGIIVKKAIQLCFMTPSYPRTKNALAGVVFFGTPHADTDSEALLQSVKGTIEAFGPKDGVRSEDVREFVSIVSRINTTFIACKPSYLRLLSFWENLPSKTVGSSTDSHKAPVIPLQCQKEKLQGNTDHIIECSHEELPRFSSIFSDRFMQFMQIFSQFLVDTLSERTVPTFPAKIPRAPSRILERPFPIEEIPGIKKLDFPIIKPRRRIWKVDDDLHSRERQKKEEEETASRESFLRSLSGWSDINYGNELYVAAGTCEWFKDGTIYKNWLTDPKCGTIFYIGAPGHGKSHLARAIFTHLKISKPDDVVMSYFCQRGEEKPAIWEYFTWKLIKEWPDWFLHVPIQFRRSNDESSPRLDSSSYAEIWTAFRKVCSRRTIYLVVDGLEQTPSANFTEFFALIEHLRQPINMGPESRPSNPLDMPTKVKLVITSRWTDATYSASSTTSCCTLPDEDLRKDVSTYLNKRFLAISNSRQKSDKDLIQKIKERVIQKAGAYWLYAKLAADEIEKSSSLNPIQEIQEDYIPTELAQLYEQKMLPLLQSANNSERHLRTVLTLIASEGIGLAFSIKQLDSILECLYGQDDMPVESLAKSMQQYCGDLFWVSPADSLIFSVHPSVRSHLSNYLSLEHRQTNMAFICLTYLLQDRFCERLPLVWTDREGTSDRMAKTAAFYGFASQCWLTNLPKLKTLNPQLVPLLQKFLSPDCPQYQTWLHWKAWLLSEKLQEKALPAEDPIMAMVREGCLAVIQHFFPASGSPRAPWKSRLGSWTRYVPFPNAQLSNTFTTRWPNITGLHDHTLLMAAALSGNRGMVEHVLQWNVDVNARDEGGRTALTLCLTSDRLMGAKAQDQNVYDVVETLLLNGVNPNICDQHGITALHVVSVRGRHELAQLLLRFGALLNVTDMWGITPLERAYSAGNVELVKLLMDFGADTEAWMLGGEPPLTRCIFDGKLDMFNAFLPYADINQATMIGFAPIHLASDGADRIEFLRILLSMPGLDLDAVSSLTERFHVKRTTAIGFAINSRNYTALEWLLEAGAYPGLLPMVSVPPLHDAVIVQDRSMVELLLFYGASVNDFRRNWFPYTALGHAVDLGLESIVDLLLQNGADASIEEGYGVVALLETAVTRDGPPIPKIIKKLLESHHPPDVNYFKENEDHCIIGAVDQGDVETVSTLLEHGADMSIYLNSGERVSPLHKAARKGNAEMCDILLKHEPNLVDLQLEKGFMVETPLNAACHKKKKDVVRFLLDKGAKVELVSYYYKESPLFTACDVGDMDIVKMVLEAAPHMINVPTVYNCTPLSFACSHGNLEMVKLLIDAGAEMYLPNGAGTTSAFSRIFDAKGDKPFKTLQLLLNNGLDLHAVDNETGLTVLGWAIIDAEARHVKWLLEQGADPLRAQRGPGSEETWQTAIQVAAHTSNKNIMPIIDLLLEPRWGLREHLTHRDYQGGTLVPALARSRKGMPIISRLMSACDTIFKETGNDIFSAIMDQPSHSGLTPVDYAMGIFDAKPEALPDLDKLIIARIDELLAGPRTMEIHLLTLDYVAILLFARGGYDADARVLAEFILTRPQVRWNDDDGYYMGSVALQQCFVCDKSIYDPYIYCTLCENSWCSECKDKEDMISLHKHKFFPIELRKDLDINAPDIQEILERIHKQLTSNLASIEGQPQQDGEILTSNSPTHAEPPPPPASTQASLSLATLHAFNFLAIARPIWTPFLPLSPSAEALVDPWHALWSREYEYRRWRSFMERRSMNYENSAWRRFQELQYLKRGFTRAYTDGERVKQDLVLCDIRRLFDDRVVVRPMPPRKWPPVVRKRQ
ncbi:Ankyrin-2 [Trichoderma lentiforme]|uniref:Ankyrin-2 n=1 Tax=Trichoderma lentiforme TaxID=1567552 RepID=A0A9P4XC67_9HYPO|nr:Ankyrin-2 [Trichoderma lentiforme]